MLPAAPLTFSMTTDCPSDTRMRSFRTRASTSAGPAAGNGTMMGTGPDGKPCAPALRDVAASAAAPAASWKNSRRRSVITHPPEPHADLHDGGVDHPSSHPLH